MPSSVEEVSDSRLVCQTGPSEGSADVRVRVVIGLSERTVPNVLYHYLDDPVITDASPSESFYEGGRVIQVIGSSLDAVQQPVICVGVETLPGQRVKRTSRLAFLTTKQLVFNSTMTVGQVFTYHPNPELFSLNRDTPDVPYRFKPGGVIAIQGVGLTRAVSRGEVVARLGDEECEVKTLDDTHMYCEPPEEQPRSLNGLDLPSLTVFALISTELGRLMSTLVQRGRGRFATSAALLPCPRGFEPGPPKSLQRLWGQDQGYKLQFRRRPLAFSLARMTIIRDLAKAVALNRERVFFPGQQAALLSQRLDVPETRRATVEQGLSQLYKMLNNKTFLTKFIHTLEAQQGFSQRDRGYVASLLTVALHDKLEYFTDVMKTLLQHLVQQYVSKNPKLMLRRHLQPGAHGCPCMSRSVNWFHFCSLISPLSACQA
ncbi:hypothetical protein CRUP_004478 [Coryphaenoides rupestris]|nr:hypothetical protein CRUP_004478 [Coryphaenoides rupestris]